MRTSGGARDSMMTVVPLVMLIAFVIGMRGGVGPALSWFEDVLREGLDGLVHLMS